MGLERRAVTITRRCYPSRWQFVQPVWSPASLWLIANELWVIHATESGTLPGTSCIYNTHWDEYWFAFTATFEHAVSLGSSTCASLYTDRGTDVRGFVSFFFLISRDFIWEELITEDRRLSEVSSLEIWMVKSFYPLQGKTCWPWVATAIPQSGAKLANEEKKADGIHFKHMLHGKRNYKLNGPLKRHPQDFGTLSFLLYAVFFTVKAAIWHRNQLFF